MELQKIWIMQGILFMLIVIGIAVNRLNIVRSEDKRVLTDLVIGLFLPASIINSFQVSFDSEVVKTFGVLLGLSTLSMVISYAIGAFVFAKRDHKQKAALRFGTLISNGGFVGMPVAESFYGSLGLMYASIYIVPIRIALWTVGLSFFTKEKDVVAGIKKVAVHPCLVAAYIGLGMLVLGLRFVEPVGKTIAMVGKCTTPVAMILIGVMIGEVKDLKSIFSGLVLRYSIIRVIVIPGIMYGIGSFLHLDPLVTGIAVVMAAMPAATTTPILAAKYEGDYILGMEMVVMSTLISLFTIPIWRMIL
ncbi:AEC family transporter [Gottschalkiaceae bacterium SANA]|nr:AEC family transporter [Gottschalkiaceae bacterium SANA]